MKIKDPKYLIGFSKSINGEPTGFEEKIRSGVKLLTIRQAGKKPPPKVGQLLRMYMSLRTNQCRPVFDFNTGETEQRCTGVWPIHINTVNGNTFIHSLFFLDILGAESSILVTSDTYCMDDLILKKLAVMDGWSYFSEMINYFEKPFVGNLIFWGNRNGY